MKQNRMGPKSARDTSLQSTDRLAALLKASRSFVETLDLQTVLQATVDGVNELLGLDSAAVYLLEDDSLHLWATTPPLPADFPHELRVAPLPDHPHIREAVTSGVPVFLADMRTADLSPAERSVMEQRNLRTVLYLPLIAELKAMGALIVGSVDTQRSISEADVDLALTLANLAALAVRNAHLYDEVKSYADELEDMLAERERGERERDQLQMRLAQAEKLESVGRLAGGVAHDFNNLLTVILGHAELALMRIAPSDPVYAAIQEIQTAGERSAKLTQQLLAFARRQATAPRVLNLNAAIEVGLKMVRRLIGEDIELLCLSAPDLWAVKMDPVQVDQILINLCLNGRDSITQAGKLVIETANVTFDESFCNEHADCIPGGYAMLSVRDNGCGMDRKTLDRLFEPFFTTKKVGEGTGLGLATVYGIVKQNEGFIDVQSTPGHGTTVRVYLRRHVKEGGHAERVTTRKPVAKGKETVLIVEDEPVLLDLTRRMLEMNGYRILAARTPGEALRLAEEHVGPVHLLLTDVVMPEMNGRYLAEKLESRFPGLKPLFMSGYTANIIAHHGILEEGVHFIQKPFSMEDLAAKVRETLED